MTAIFPTLPGLGWSVTKTPRFAGRIQNAISGRELRVLDQVNPIWTWTLTYSLLRDKWDARAATGPGIGYDELRTLAGFFLQQQGTFRPFLFDDPTDNTVADQVIGNRRRQHARVSARAQHGRVRRADHRAECRQCNTVQRRAPGPCRVTRLIARPGW